MTWASEGSARKPDQNCRRRQSIYTNEPPTSTHGRTSPTLDRRLQRHSLIAADQQQQASSGTAHGCDRSAVRTPRLVARQSRSLVGVDSWGAAHPLDVQRLPQINGHAARLRRLCGALFLDEARNCYEHERPRPDVPALSGSARHSARLRFRSGGSRAPIPERERFSDRDLRGPVDAIRRARTLVCH